jgi:hypothetical protein
MGQVPQQPVETGSGGPFHQVDIGDGLVFDSISIGFPYFING